MLAHFPTPPLRLPLVGRTLSALCVSVIAFWVFATPSLAAPARAPAQPMGGASTPAAQPITHLVVIFDENVSFDHYFGTYPDAANTDGTPFHAKANTPAVNGLNWALLHHNPNGINPKRLSPSEAFTCDMDHEYKAEQEAYDRGLVDRFPRYTQRRCDNPKAAPLAFYTPGIVMDYYDGNTVTALWNYAQHYSMSDNNFGSQFGPSSIGAFNLAAGRTAPVYAVEPHTNKRAPLPSKIGSVEKDGLGTLYSDEDPRFDDCSDNHAPQVVATGNNVGELLSKAHVTWGWFQGGFVPTAHTKDGRAVCARQHANVAGFVVRDYTPHWDPFQYYATTSNPHHLAPARISNIGRPGPANHNYGLRYFYEALAAGQLPAISYVKSPAYESGHAGKSDPLDEQYFLVNVINAVEHSRYWPHTAIIVTYDDSDGWYDQAMPPILNPSVDPKLDALTAPGKCGHGKPLGGYQDRCGYGPRLPLVVISPYAKRNYISHALTDQTSILKFIEDRWLGGERLGEGSYDALAAPLSDLFDFDRAPHLQALTLNPCTGAMMHGSYSVQRAAGYRQSSGKAMCHWPPQAGRHR